MSEEYGIHVKTASGTVEVLKPGMDRRVTALETASAEQGTAITTAQTTADTAQTTADTARTAAAAAQTTADEARTAAAAAQTTANAAQNKSRAADTATLWNGSSRTISSAAASGTPADGAIWFQYY